MKKTASAIVLILIVMFGVSTYAEENKGAAEINLPSGNKKSVDFPHKVHQDVLKDCTICHSIFPMEKGIILKKVTDGTMKKKTVMKQCQACHRKLAKQGRKAGPTSCSKCHTGKM